MKQEEKYTRADRDLLITVNTKLDALTQTVKEMKDNLVHRVESLEDEKADRCLVDELLKLRVSKWSDYDRRLSKLENWKSYSMGIFAVIGVLASLVVYIYFVRYDYIKTQIYETKILLEKHIDHTN